MSAEPDGGRSEGGGGAAEPRGGGRPARPRLGFLGVGWIGRNRMEAVIAGGDAEVAAVCDPSPDMREAALQAAPRAEAVDGIEPMLEMGLDGLVIATPSALHASQSIAALERGIAVFCQKPLARTAEETRRVVSAARDADRLLGVDLSYRHTSALRAVREVVRSGEIGTVYAVELVFHNAYGPDKPWFYDRRLSGGGCLIDLGIHLVDAALWTLGFPAVQRVTGRLLAKGRPLAAGGVEDYATARVDLDGAVMDVACSWGLPAGEDAVIRASFYGTGGGVALRNVNGSFYDFVAERYRGTSREVLVEPPDAWGGRSAAAWAARLRRDPRFDPDAERLVDVAAVLDRIYACE